MSLLSEVRWTIMLEFTACPLNLKLTHLSNNVSISDAWLPAPKCGPLSHGHRLLLSIQISITIAWSYAYLGLGILLSIPEFSLLYTYINCYTGVTKCEEICICVNWSEQPNSLTFYIINSHGHFGWCNIFVCVW